MTYDNSNRIALWPNTDRKQQSHPHIKGKGETSEPVYASAWFSDEIADADKQLLAGILSRYQSRKPFVSISIKSVAEASQGVNNAVQPASQYGLNSGQQNAPPVQQPAMDDSFENNVPF